VTNCCAVRVVSQVCASCVRLPSAWVCPCLSPSRYGAVLGGGVSRVLAGCRGQAGEGVHQVC
jgi:hypothetical protein